MLFRNVAILTSKKSWFVEYSKKLVCELNKKGHKAVLFFDHKKISRRYEVVFILSYFSIIERQYLLRHEHNLVVHESALPKGRGWSPLFWQILEGKRKIPIVMLEADERVDEGPIYLKDYINLKGHELYSEIRKKQALKTIDLCLTFLLKNECFKPKRQKGRPTYYRKRNPADSKLDLDKTIREQFDKLRIVDNKQFPAFFDHKGNRYFIEISKEKTK